MTFKKKYFQIVKIIICLLLANSAMAQQRPDSVFRQTQRIDSIGKIAKDSVKKTLDTNKITFKKFVKVVFTDEISPKKRPAMKATYRSMILAGWGQITNKEYWVLPIVYGAAGVGVYVQSVNIHNYRAFKNALTEIVVNKQKATVNYKGWFSAGGTIEYSPTTEDISRVTPIVNTYRRYRDLAYFSFVLGWALQIVQANVSAHLRGFDTSDNISLKINPQFNTGVGNANLGLRISMDF
jgi:hypothetical protein